MTRVLVIDNYDSFTYNLVQYLGELGADLEVVRNDAQDVGALMERGFDRLVVSPGPCTPADAGVSVDAIRSFAEQGVPVLGVCLGHQALAEAFGGRVVRGEPVHGKTAPVEHDGRTIFTGLESPLVAGRYHSLVVDPELPDCLERSAFAGDVVMGLRHRELPAEGVQFHPESVLTEQGKGLLRNFLGMTNPVLTDAIDRVAGREGLSADDAARVLHEIMAGEASEAETAAFLIALRTKGESVQEITGLARAMRELAVPVDAGDGLVDTAGTGGGRPTFNVSTAAGLIAAGAGCRVAKHGNRSATSRCGSADVLEALGAKIDLAPERVADCILTVGFGFMFAPLHHQAMKHVVPVRKELAVRTVFNFLGPLTNPAGATRQVIGVSQSGAIEDIGHALRALGTERALVVSSADGLDEFSVAGPTRVVELTGDEFDTYAVGPEDFGIESADDAAVGAGTPDENAEVLRSVLRGDAGTARSMAVMNAGAAIYVGGLADSLGEGARLAEAAIDSGAAREVLERYVELSRA